MSNWKTPNYGNIDAEVREMVQKTNAKKKLAGHSVQSKKSAPPETPLEPSNSETTSRTPVTKNVTSESTPSPSDRPLADPKPKKISSSPIRVTSGNTRGKRLYSFPNKGYGQAVRLVGPEGHQYLDKNPELRRTSVRVPNELLAYAKSSLLAMAGEDPQTSLTNNKFLMTLCLSFIDNPDHRNVLKELYLYDSTEKVKTTDGLKSRKHDRYARMMDVIRNEGGERNLTPDQAVIKNTQTLQEIKDQLAKQNENASLNFHDIMSNNYSVGAMVAWIMAERSGLLNNSDYPENRENVPGALNSEIVRSIARHSQKVGAEYYHSHDARRRKDQF